MGIKTKTQQDLILTHNASDVSKIIELHPLLYQETTDNKVVLKNIVHFRKYLVWVLSTCEYYL